MAKTQKALSVIRDEEEDKQPYVKQINNSLTMKLTQLNEFDPLTQNQSLFFDAYYRGDYFIGLLGSAGTGKCIGGEEYITIMVEDELANKLLSG